MKVIQFTGDDSKRVLLDRMVREGLRRIDPSGSIYETRIPAEYADRMVNSYRGAGFTDITVTDA